MCVGSAQSTLYCEYLLISESYTVEPPNNGHIGSRPFSIAERCLYL